jgi:Zinc knuckle
MDTNNTNQNLNKYSTTARMSDKTDVNTGEENKENSPSRNEMNGEPSITSPQMDGSPNAEKTISENSGATIIEIAGTIAQSSGTVSGDNDVMELDVDPKPQNVNSSLELEESTEDVQSVEPARASKKWSSFFTQLRRGQATFSNYTPRVEITTKNNNALIFDIRSLNDIQMNDIISTLYSKIGNDLVGAKPHYTRGKRTHLELVFSSEDKQQHYAKEGISLFRRSLLGYIPTNLRRTHLAIKVRNVPIGDKDFISNKLKEAFGDFGHIKSIKPLVYEDTPVCTDQWIILYETTEDPELEQKIPRHTSVWGQKVTTEWRAAPKLCFYCDQAGHLKRDCPQYKEAIELRKQYKKYKENKRHKRENLDETNRNGNNTDKEQNNEGSKESDGLVQDTLVGDDIEMLSQEGESLETMLEEDRNKENQQEIQDNMLQQVEANTGIHQDMPVEQVDLKETNQQAQISTEDTGTNPLNLAHESVQTQLQESNVEVQEDDGFTTVKHKKLRTKKNICSNDSKSRPYVNNRLSRDGRNK